MFALLLPFASPFLFPHYADIEQARKDGQRILVHCVMGKSRSVTFVLAYLMQYRDMHLRPAFEFVYSRRSVIKPNRGFMQSLIDYESQLFPTLEKPTISVDEWVGIVGEHGSAKGKTKVTKVVTTTYHPPAPSPSGPSREQKILALFDEHFPEQAVLDGLSQLPMKNSSIARAIQIGRVLLDGDTVLRGKLALERIGMKDLYKHSDSKVKILFQGLIEGAD